MEPEELLTSINNMSEEQKIRFGKMLKLSDKNNIETKEEKELKELQEKLEKTMNKGSEIDKASCATKSDVEQIKVKVDSLQLELLELMKHMREYTKRYIDITKEQQSKGILEYLNSIKDQDSTIQKLDEIKEVAIKKEEEEEKKKKEGTVKRVAEGTFNAMKQGISGINSMLNTAGNNIAGAVGSLTGVGENTEEKTTNANQITELQNNTVQEIPVTPINETTEPQETPVTPESETPEQQETPVTPVPPESEIPEPQQENEQKPKPDQQLGGKKNNNNNSLLDNLKNTVNNFLNKNSIESARNENNYNTNTNTNTNKLSKKQNGGSNKKKKSRKNKKKRKTKSRKKNI